MFDLMIHADWSVDPRKRWAARAWRNGTEWAVDAPFQIASTASFLDDAFAAVGKGSCLLGFDFPIGMPAAYGALTGFARFRDALPSLGEGDWGHFFNVAEVPGEISVRRPFYPRVARKGVSPNDIVGGIGVTSVDDLFRISERKTAYRNAACALFWTLGGNQVGKAALSGWQDIVRPAILRGAALWPFDGTLAELSEPKGLVIAETYPAEAYRMVDAAFRPGQSKRRCGDRQEKAEAILAWSGRNGVSLSEAARLAVRGGFGEDRTGEDRFDAFLGLLKMIDVASGRRPEATAAPDRRWEGWILGR